MKGFKILLIAAFFALTTSVVSGTAQAALAVNFSSYADVYDVSLGYNIVGWQFTANTDLYVTKLGYFDLGSVGEARSVGLYNASGTLLASATIDPLNQGAQSGFFRMIDLATKATIDKGQQYTLVTTLGSTGQFTADTTGTFGGTGTFGNLTLTDLALLGDVFATDAALPANWAAATGGVYGATTYGAFGPNMEVTATPIPAAAWLLGSGLLGLVGVRRRKK